jgi:hypothetical protein
MIRSGDHRREGGIRVMRIGAFAEGRRAITHREEPNPKGMHESSIDERDRQLGVEGELRGLTLVRLRYIPYRLSYCQLLNPLNPACLFSPWSEKFRAILSGRLHKLSF